MKPTQQYENNIKQWLEPLLADKGLSYERFARQVGVSRAQIYFYVSDQNRPSEEIMAQMCKVLGRPIEEGLRQYTPRPEGRAAWQSDTRSVAVRQRRSR